MQPPLTQAAENCLKDARKLRQDETIRCLRLLVDDCLKPKAIACNKGKKIRGHLKNQSDEKRLEKMAPPDVLKAGIGQSMLDLAALSWRYEGEDDMPKYLRHAALVAMVGIVFGNSAAGRPGEWTRITRSAVQEIIDTEGDCLVAKEHKTAETHGPVGKYVPPGSLQAMKTYMAITDASNKAFFQAAYVPQGNVTMATCVSRWCAAYTPDHGSTTPTLLRKMYTTTAADETGQQAKEIVARYNGHRVDMAKSTYTLQRTSLDAKRGRAATEVLLKGPVAWPLSEDLTEEILNTRLAWLKGEYTRTMKADKKNAEKAKKDEEEDFEEDDGEGGGEVGEPASSSTSAPAQKKAKVEKLTMKKTSLQTALSSLRVQCKKEQAEQTEREEEGEGGGKAAKGSSSSTSAPEKKKPQKNENFTKEQKDYLRRLAASMGYADKQPPAVLTKKIIQQAIKDKVLPEDVSEEKVRNLLRNRRQ